MSKTRINLRTVSGVSVIDVYQNVTHPDDLPKARGSVVSALTRRLPVLISQLYPEKDITDYLARGVRKIDAYELEQVAKHGLDRYLQNFQPMYEPPELRERYDTTRTGWAYPIDGDPFYPIGSALGHAIEERKRDPALSESKNPVGLLLLRKKGAVILSTSYYGFSNLPGGLGAITLVHFW